MMDGQLRKRSMPGERRVSEEGYLNVIVRKARNQMQLEESRATVWEQDISQGETQKDVLSTLDHSPLGNSRTGFEAQESVGEAIFDNEKN